MQKYLELKSPLKRQSTIMYCSTVQGHVKCTHIIYFIQYSQQYSQHCQQQRAIEGEKNNNYALPY